MAGCEMRWRAGSPEELAGNLEGAVASLRGRPTNLDRERALELAARAMGASGAGRVEVCGGRVRGAEHTWVQAGSWWADPAGAAMWPMPAAGRIPHPLAGRPEWRDFWRGRGCPDTGSRLK